MRGPVRAGPGRGRGGSGPGTPKIPIFRDFGGGPKNPDFGGPGGGPPGGPKTAPSPAARARGHFNNRLNWWGSKFLLGARTPSGGVWGAPAWGGGGCPGGGSGGVPGGGPGEAKKGLFRGSSSGVPSWVPFPASSPNLRPVTQYRYQYESVKLYNNYDFIICLYK
jgi:hypothetical protein